MPSLAVQYAPHSCPDDESPRRPFRSALLPMGLLARPSVTPAWISIRRCFSAEPGGSDLPGPRKRRPQKGRVASMRRLPAPAARATGRPRHQPSAVGARVPQSLHRPPRRDYRSDGGLQSPVRWPGPPGAGPGRMAGTGGGIAATAVTAVREAHGVVRRLQAGDDSGFEGALFRNGPGFGRASPSGGPPFPCWWGPGASG